MKCKAVRLYGAEDIRCEEFDLRDIRDDEILAEVVTDSLCMSTYKAMKQGSKHRCIPENIGEKPVILGHELCGRVMKVGAKAQTDLVTGDLFAVQAKMVFGDRITSPGYSYETYGGNTTRIIVPAEVVRGGYLLPFHGGACYQASVAEPYSCLIYALRSMYHLGGNSKKHIMGVKEGGSMAILAGAGPMGLGAAEAAMAMPSRPAQIVITDIDDHRLQSARRTLKPKNGVLLDFVNVKDMEDQAAYLTALTDNGGFDDVMVMAPVSAVIETADRIAGEDSCINFFAGPTKREFYANVNFYDVHYQDKHMIGTSGGDVDDMKEALHLIESGAIQAELMITHIGGLDSVAEATYKLPTISGGKKLIYCGLDMALTAISDFEEKGKDDPLFAKLHEICARHDMLWSKEAEDYLLKQ